MKIQVAFDRISIGEFLQAVKEISNEVDIIEIGTSLLREYGLNPLNELFSSRIKTLICSDAKIVDNVLYELPLYYNAGSDLVTVMGCSPIETIKKALKLSKNLNKEIMIDLLNVSKETLKNLVEINQDNIIYILHIGEDQQNKKESIQIDYDYFSILKGKRIAVSGGLDDKNILNLKAYFNEIEIIIVGKYVTQSDNKVKAIKRLKELYE